MEYLKPYMVAVDSSPYKIGDKLQSLREKFVPDHTHMPYESSVATLQRLVHIHASKTMSHLLSIMVSYDFEIVSLIAFFHFLKQGWHVIKGISHLWSQFVTISLRKAFKFRRINLKRL